MAADELSQAELETLLNTMRPDVGAEMPTRLAGQSWPVARPETRREGIAPYDFKHPAASESMLAWQTLHEGCAHRFGSALSSLLRSTVEVKLSALDQTTYGEFASGLEDPTCFHLLRVLPLGHSWLLDINPSILYPLIDRLLGGGGESGAIAQRPMTEIELRLVSRMTGLFLEELHKTWRDVVPLEISVERVENNPRWVQVVAPSEVVVVLRFELAMQQSRGLMQLCIPFRSLESIGRKVFRGATAKSAGRTGESEAVNQVGANLQHAVVELVAHLAETKIATMDMLNLRVGDIITTEQDVRSPFAVSLEGVTKFRAQPGALKGHKAIQIEEVVGLTAGRGSPQ